MLAQIVHGGYTDTPGLSPAISQCIHGLLQDVGVFTVSTWWRHGRYGV